jgi:hypothetical protein
MFGAMIKLQNATLYVGFMCNMKASAKCANFMLKGHKPTYKRT